MTSTLPDRAVPTYWMTDPATTPAHTQVVDHVTDPSLDLHGRGRR
jgi:hypothetical protein